MPHVDTFRNGKKLVSVTELQTIIGKPYLETWRTKLCHCKTHQGKAGKSPFKPAELEAIKQLGPGHCGSCYADLVRDDAGSLGTEVHEVVEKWFKDPEMEMDLNIPSNLWASKIVTLYEAHKVAPKIILPEGTMVDEESGLAGSPDLIGEWGGRIEIIDTKIKNSLDDWTGAQGAGYRYLLNLKHGVDIRWMRVVWCKKEDPEQSIEDVLIDLDEWIEPWKALVTLWNTTHKRRRVVVRGQWSTGS